MNKTLLLASITLGIINSYTSIAQHTSIPKLEIAKGDTYTVGPENTLYVDTLILHDKATIRFASSQYGVLDVKTAYIGKKCTVTSKGADGSVGKGNRPGQDGKSGGNLTFSIHFEELGSLTIDTRGGKGGDGVNGRNGHEGSPDKHETQTVVDPATGKTRTITVIVPGSPGTDGTNATMGGNGGNGGNIMFVYSTNGFIPIFNNEKANKNSITILHTKGMRGTTGVPGRGGLQRMDGVVLYSEIKPDIDGQIILVNQNSQ
ncbi:MAG: hypothetical protein LPK09_11205 [Hymenobacteraceae bacterium]|nr:hypothetical protein [Hymenobacteraceae bacterium]